MARRNSIIKEIQNRIVSGELSNGSRLPSERTLAEELGVSRTAVQAAIREMESLGVISRQTNCRPLVSAQLGQTQPKADQIGVWMLPETQDVGGAMIIQGILSTLGQYRFSALIQSPPSLDKESVWKTECDFLRSILDNPKAAGVITWDTTNPLCTDLYRKLSDRGIPLVFVDREPELSVTADVVSVNHRRSAKLAVQHLIDLGHRSIGMVVGNDHASSVRDRIEGYRSTLQENRLNQDPDFLFQLDTKFNAPEKADRLLDQIIGMAKKAPTALFTVNDRVALLLMEAAARKGIRIPQDLSIVGFDWLARGTNSGGSLTTVAQPFELIGQAAAQRILDRIANPNAIPRQILFEAKLIQRESTAKPSLPLKSIASSL